MGHSMVNVHLNDVASIQQALNKPNIFSNNFSMIQNTVAGDKKRYAKFMKEDIMRNILIVNNDYNFDNEIERAF
jgi:hypothetical protein